jgi:hypothetical protein
MKFTRILVMYAVLALYTVAPILSVFIASGVASHAGAKLDEGEAHPCIILGHDFGELLHAMFVFGWLALLTVPSGLLAMLVFTIVLFVRRGN